MPDKFDEQAEKFMKKNKVIMTIRYLRCYPYFDTDVQGRDVYNVKLNRGNKTIRFKFCQALMKSRDYPNEKREIAVRSGLSWHEAEKRYPYEPPSTYSILAALTKFDPLTLDEFQKEYGYNGSSSNYRRIYRKVRKEWLDVNDMFNDVIEELREIA